MSAVMVRTVVVRDPDTLNPVALLEGKPVPDWAIDLVHADDLVSADDQNGGSDEYEVDESDLGASTVAQLIAYAEANEIDLGEAKKKADVVTVLEAAIAERDQA